MPSRPTTDQIIQRLRAVSLFEMLDDASMVHLARETQWREYRAGEVIVLEGEAQPGLYFLAYGYAKAVKYSAAGSSPFATTARAPSSDGTSGCRSTSAS